MILKSSSSKHLVKHGEGVDSSENNNSPGLFIGINCYSKKIFFPLKFHKQRVFSMKLRKETTQVFLKKTF